MLLVAATGLAEHGGRAGGRVPATGRMTVAQARTEAARCDEQIVEVRALRWARTTVERPHYEGTKEKATDEQQQQLQTLVKQQEEQKQEKVAKKMPIVNADEANECRGGEQQPPQPQEQVAEAVVPDPAFFTRPCSKIAVATSTTEPAPLPPPTIDNNDACTAA